MNSLILKIKVFLYPYYYEYIALPLEYKKRKRKAKLLGKKEHIKVVFFAMSLPMWKYQRLYNLLKKDQRFQLYIVLSPAITFTHEKQMMDVVQMRDYFTRMNIPYIDCYIEEKAKPYDVKGKINPDIVFHAQPYEGAVVKEHSPSNFMDKLLCEYPYAYITIALPFNYNLEYHIHAWKLYMQNEIQYKIFKKRNPMKGRNVVVVGYPKADDFLENNCIDVWKPQNVKKKRIIWAPHFSLVQSAPGMQPRSNFLWMADKMKKFAQKYSDTIQFAFKPHPRLRSDLYKHPDWGISKTDNYYHFWEDSPYTQFEDADFIDLFKSSDAIIHDSGSFLVDYMYTKKPAMFITDKLDLMKAEADNFAKQVYDCYYIGKSEKDIEDFIVNVVLKDIDPLREARNNIYDKYLKPPCQTSVAQKTVDDLYKSLGIKK
jgi:hypothetical protein